jgi:hypothetical protein
MTHFKFEDMQQITETKHNAWKILSNHFKMTIAQLRSEIILGKIDEIEALRVLDCDLESRS